MTKQAINGAPVVFVVDDDIDVREGSKSLVELAGLRCEVFASTREFPPRKKAADAVSCLVLDVRLPGMSGLDLPAGFARTHADIPTIHHRLWRYSDGRQGDEGRRGRIPHQAANWMTSGRAMNR